jgi:hypothetical protein
MKALIRRTGSGLSQYRELSCQTAAPRRPRAHSLATSKAHGYLLLCSHEIPPEYLTTPKSSLIGCHRCHRNSFRSRKPALTSMRS